MSRGLRWTRSRSRRCEAQLLRFSRWANGLSGCTPPIRGGREDDELLGGAGHRDVAIDCSLDALAEVVRVDEHDEVELEPFGQLRRQGRDPRPCGERRIA